MTFNVHKNKRTKANRILLLLLAIVIVNTNNKILAQVVLSADGTTDTYKLINSVLAPGYNVVETPDCGHEAFGDHIDQTFDQELKSYVFRFHIHVDEDDDRCKNSDRQRTEIKTYDKSPQNLKAIAGETVEYKWKFKLDSNFQTSPAFTHLHQIKAVGGSEEGMPLITLTARYDNKLQLRYAKHTSQETIGQTALKPLLGYWVEATERITYGETGSYIINIIRLNEKDTVFSYSNTNIRMWKTDADFLRPKWGIYRSLDHWEYLRDEIVYFNDFSIEELDLSSIKSEKQSSIGGYLYPNPSNGMFKLSAHEGATLEIYDMNGKALHSYKNAPVDQKIKFNLKKGIYIINLVYPSYTLKQKLIVT